MTKAEVEAFLAEPRHLVRIGTVAPDGGPLVVPAWFLLRDGWLFVTPRARSGFFRHIEAEPRVCFSIDETPLPYRKVTVRGSAEVFYRPGDDDEWRDIYRDICLRYWSREEVDSYFAATQQIRRNLIGLRFDYDDPGVTTWRLPVDGEDPSGIWARRYWET